VPVPRGLDGGLVTVHPGAARRVRVDVSVQMHENDAARVVAPVCRCQACTKRPRACASRGDSHDLPAHRHANPPSRAIAPV